MSPRSTCGRPRIRVDTWCAVRLRVASQPDANRSAISLVRAAGSMSSSAGFVRSASSHDSRVVHRQPVRRAVALARHRAFAADEHAAPRRRQRRCALPSSNADQLDSHIAAAQRRRLRGGNCSPEMQPRPTDRPPHPNLAASPNAWKWIVPSRLAYNSKPSRFANCLRWAKPLCRRSTAKRGSVGPSSTVPASNPACSIRSRAMLPALWSSYQAAVRRVEQLLHRAQGRHLHTHKAGLQRRQPCPRNTSSFSPS